MNPERMRAVADAIEESGRFHYAAWGARTTEDGAIDECISSTKDLREHGTLRHCGTTGCIAGWAATLALELPKPLPVQWRKDMMISDIAQEYLGLDHDEAQMLFLGQAMVYAGFYEHDGEALAKGTAIEAAKVLRMVADGEVVL